MINREKLEVAGIFEKLVFNLTEMPPDFDPRKDAEDAGYRYIRITISDVDTGNPAVIRLAALEGGPASSAIYTFCKDEHIGQLIGKILEVAQLPEDLLEEYYPAIIVGSDVVLDGKHNAGQVAFKRILGGRKKGSRTTETKEKYDEMLRRRWSPYWGPRSSKEFFETFPQYNYQSLARAVKWDSEGRP